VNVNLNSVTATLRSVWDELVERRLWPVALVLVVAIVAVPVLLAKPAKQPPVPPTPPAATGAGPGVAFQPAVSAEGKKSSEIRKKVRRFTRKNPFTPHGLSLSAASAAGTAQPTTGTTGATGAVSSPSDLTSSLSGGGTTGSGSSSTGSSGSTGSTGTSTKTFYYHYTVDVKFGKTGEEDAKTLSEFRALPSSDNPVLVFMGVKNDGKSAVFLIAANATTTGDGKCSPTDTECTFLYLAKGDKETIEAVDTSGAVTDYTLELRDIKIKRTTGPQTASSSKAARSTARRGERTRLRRVVRSIRTLGL